MAHSRHFDRAGTIAQLGGGYLAGWTLGERLGQNAATIQGAGVKYGHGNEYELALHELVTLGLVEEMPNLGERWRLIIKEK